MVKIITAHEWTRFDVYFDSYDPCDLCHMFVIPLLLLLLCKHANGIDYFVCTIDRDIL